MTIGYLDEKEHMIGSSVLAGKDHSSPKGNGKCSLQRDLNTECAHTTPRSLGAYYCHLEYRK